jgi:hypothetical protein
VQICVCNRISWVFASTRYNYGYPCTRQDEVITRTVFYSEGIAVTPWYLFMIAGYNNSDFHVFNTTSNSTLYPTVTLRLARKALGRIVLPITRLPYGVGQYPTAAPVIFQKVRR